MVEAQKGGLVRGRVLPRDGGIDRPVESAGLRRALPRLFQLSQSDGLRPAPARSRRRPSVELAKLLRRERRGVSALAGRDPLPQCIGKERESFLALQLGRVRSQGYSR